jgi:acyl-CoA thioester hydrolase
VAQLDRETVFRIRVRSTDLDGLGHVNNSIFFQYFEQARLEHCARLGRQPVYAREGGARHRFALAETTCRYRAPALFGDTLRVVVRTTEVGQRSFALAYEVRRDGDDTLIAEGSSVQVWLDESGRPAPLPEEFRVSLERSRDSG